MNVGNKARTLFYVLLFLRKVEIQRGGVEGYRTSGINWNTWNKSYGNKKFIPEVRNPSGGVVWSEANRLELFP